MRDRHRQSGMSLIEVLAALTILALVVMSVIGLFAQSVAVNAAGMDYATVNNLARDRLEQLMALPFTDPRISLDADIVGPDGTEQTFPDSVDGLPFEIEYTVRGFRLPKAEDAATALATPVAIGADAGNLKEITVTVRSQRFLLPGRRIIEVSGFKADGLR